MKLLHSILAYFPQFNVEEKKFMILALGSKLDRNSGLAGFREIVVEHGLEYAALLGQDLSEMNDVKETNEIKSTYEMNAIKVNEMYKK